MRNVIAGILVACGLSQAALAAPEPSIERLKPGQFVWSPELAPSGLLTIVVDLAAQRAHVYRDGVEIGVTTISSGKRGHETPPGVFTILQKAKVYRSRKYDNAPMPNMQRLTWGGIALHGGRVPGHPASHGCIRLPVSFSQTLFKETSLGTTVIITEGSSSVEALAERGLPLVGNVDFRWQPELSPAGPVTVLVSFKYRQILVLRDGMTIGRAAMEIPAGMGRDLRALQIVATGKPGDSQWFHAGPSGREAHRSQPGNADQVVQVRVAPEFLAALRAAATPGATILIAEDAVTTSEAPLLVMVSG